MKDLALQREQIKPMEKRTRDKNWIEAATSKNKGSFAKSARKAGKSTPEFANKEQSAPGKMGRRARLAKTLMGLNK